MNRRDLLTQIIWHWRAIGFVFSVNIVAEGFALGIEDHHMGAIRIVFLEASHHIDHPFNRTGGLAFAVGQRRQCVVGAIEVRGAIDENQRGSSVHIFHESY